MKPTDEQVEAQRLRNIYSFVGCPHGRTGKCKPCEDFIATMLDDQRMIDEGGPPGDDE